MSSARTFGTVLKRFQQDAVDNGTAIFTNCLSELARLKKDAKNYEQNKRLIVGQTGAILFEAPTGTGKTLMAGHVAENISQLHATSSLPKVIWFWIAPFSGLIDQAIRTIRTEFSSLRPRNPITDREPTNLMPGDVFVTTWASVAVANETSRKARTSTEEMPSLDDLVSYARSQGFAIGVVIDEAHHTFRGQTQAFAFYRNVLAPELTILATATPRDKDVDAFANSTGITNLGRISVSRQQAIDDRLIKEGVKVAVFKAPTDVESLIDFKRTALKQGVATHRRLKQAIAEAGLSVTPLLLVQVDSEPGSVEQATAWLKELGFRTDGESGLIRIHTADEPDPHLSTIAADETVEVLIFKLAVATGFDVPRAFTLVSFRPSRDEDFGVQIVGRILRVDRRLQVVKNLPAPLRYGYVLLSDNAGQTGLTGAAQRINAVKTELAAVSTNVAVVTLGSDEPTTQVIHKGQITFHTDSGLTGVAVVDTPENETDPGGGAEASPEASVPDQQPGGNGPKSQAGQPATGPGPGGSITGIQTPTATIQTVLFEEWNLTPAQPSSGNQSASGTGSQPKNPGGHFYPLNQELGAPRSFRRAVLSLNNADIVAEIVARFRFDDEMLLLAQRNSAAILMQEVEIFQNRKDRVEEIQATLAQKDIDARAQQTLFRTDEYNVIDVRVFHKALMDRMRAEVRRKGIEEIFDTDAKLRDGLHKILALRPDQLKKAVSQAVAKHTECIDAAQIPESILSANPLDPARLNLYGVFPDDLNSWERQFAEYLDNDLTGTVLWWHRNPPRKPFSVSLPLPGQPDFYPDFVVGIKNRIRGNGILLMETKRVINDQERNALVKAQAEHPEYGKVMMIYWEDSREWRVVEYDPSTDKNFLDRVLRPEIMATY